MRSISEVLSYQPSRETFETSLTMAGLPIINRRRVWAQQVKAVLEVNPGWWLLIRYILWLPVLWSWANVLHARDDEAEYDNPYYLSPADFVYTLLGGAVLWALAALIGAILCLSTGSLWWLLLAFPLAGVIFVTCLYMYKPAGLSDSLCYWQRVPADDYFASPTEGPAPSHIRERYEQLRQMPGVRGNVIVFAGDPFLEAEKESFLALFGFGRRVIGAWATDTELDNI